MMRADIDVETRRIMLEQTQKNTIFALLRIAILSFAIPDKGDRPAKKSLQFKAIRRWKALRTRNNPVEV